jgi:hypothetical protein
MVVKRKIHALARNQTHVIQLIAAHRVLEYDLLSGTQPSLGICIGNALLDGIL